MVLGPTVAAIFSWNKGRMLIGAQDIALFMYLIPVVAAVVVVVALAADNVAQRRARASERADYADRARRPRLSRAVSRRAGAAA